MSAVLRLILFLGPCGILRAQMCRPAEVWFANMNMFSKAVSNCQNTLGDCECDGQIFASNDCRRAYHCRDDLSTGGCLAECGEGDIIIPDPRSVITVISISSLSPCITRNGDKWYCVPQEQEDGELIKCPGGWHNCNDSFWLRQEPKESLCLSVCYKVQSRSLNHHLSLSLR